MGKKDKSSALVTKPELSPEDIRKSLYLSALQSDRVTILVGSTEESFRVPGGLLIRYSPSFQKMCQSSFMESLIGVIKLPEVEISTFKNFLIWLHAFQPSIQIESFQAVVNLAIFAEMYLVYHLRNQTSDALRAALGNGKWSPTPEEVSTAYLNVPSGCILRKLCSFGFAHASSDRWTGVTTRQYPDTSAWRSVFENSADFGWDYFQLIQSTQSGIGEGGVCRFHDHSDIIGWKPDDSIMCPYAQGGPWTLKAVADEAAKEFQEEEEGNRRRMASSTRLDEAGQEGNIHELGDDNKRTYPSSF